MMRERIPYRTLDGLTHLWTQEEINRHLAPLDDLEESMDAHQEARQTLKMLSDYFACPGLRIDHETVQELLSRIDVMCEPLKELVQAMEVHP